MFFLDVIYVDLQDVESEAQELQGEQNSVDWRLVPSAMARPVLL